MNLLILLISGFLIHYQTVEGKYSRRCFENLGYRVLPEVAYADFTDEKGELYLNDTRDHLSVITVVKEL